MTTARQQRAPKPPPWGAPQHHPNAVLPAGRFVSAGDRVCVAGRHGEWEFVRRVVTGKSEWLDVRGPLGRSATPATIPVAADKVRPAQTRRKANR
jgi:hypothetical protein